MTATSSSPETRKTVANVLGLGSVADASDTVSADAVIALYRYARNEFGNREFITHNSTFSRGWIDLDAGPSRTYLDPFYPSDGGDAKQVRRTAQANLQAIAWNDILGIDAPPIRIQVKIHGAKWGLRFVAVEASMKGRERINEELPAAQVTPGASATGGATSPPPPDVPPSPPPPSSEHPAASAAAIDDILAQAGMPA